MLRTPLSTRLLKGHEMNSRLGSRRTTSMVGSYRRTYLAAVAPPQPPPTTTTRRSPRPSVVAQPPMPAARALAAPALEIPRKALRVRSVVMADPPLRRRSLPARADDVIARSYMGPDGRARAGQQPDESRRDRARAALQRAQPARHLVPRGEHVPRRHDRGHEADGARPARDR